MAYVHDNIAFDSFEEMTYYGKAKAWLKGQHAVAVRQNAFLLSRLVLAYLDRVSPAPTETESKNAPSSETSDGKACVPSLPTSKLRWTSTGKTRETERTRRRAMANHVAAFLASNPVPSAEVSLFELETVADLVSHCQDLLQNETRDFRKKVMGDGTSEGFTVTAITTLEGFDKFTMEALRGLLRASKLSMEAFYDFNFIFQKAIENPLLRKFLEETPEGGQSEKKRKRGNGLQFTKEFGWKLTCLYTMQFDVNKGRRQRILLSTAAIGFLCMWSQLQVDGKGTKVVSASSEVSEIKADCTVKDEERDVNDCYASREKTDSKRVRTSLLEDDAIAALSMMLTSSPPVSPVPPESSSPLDTIIDIAKTLLLYLPRSLTDSDMDMEMSLSQGEVADQILRLVKTIAACRHSPAPTDDVATKRSDNSLTRLNGLLLSILKSGISVSPSTIDCAIQEVHQRQQSSASSLIQSHALIDESRLMTESDSCVGRIIHRTLNPSEASASFKRPSIFILDYPLGVSTQDVSSNTYKQEEMRVPKTTISPKPETEETSLPPSTKSMVADVIASLTSAGLELNRMEDAKVQKELRDWCKGTFNTMVAKPSKRLLRYFEITDKRGNRSTLRDVVVPVLNHVVFRLTEENMVGELQHSVARETGQFFLDDPNNPDKRLCTAVIALFFHALENLLFLETARLKTAAHPALIRNEAFHRSLLSCSYLCVVKAFGDSNSLELTVRHSEMDVIGAIAVMETTPFSFLRVSESFCRAMHQVDTSNDDAKASKLPRALLKHIASCETKLLDSYVWMENAFLGTDGSVMATIDQMQKDGRSWPPQELQPSLPEEIEDSEESVNMTTTAAVSNPGHRYAAYVIRRTLRLVYVRISKLCKALHIDDKLPVASQTWVAFRFMVRQYTRLLCDRHVDQLVLCSLYGVCRLLKYEPDLSFSTIIDAYIKVRGKDIGEKQCSHIVLHVRLDDDSQEFGNIIELYNRVYVPKMKEHLLQSKSLIRSTAWLESYYANNGDTSEMNFDPQGYVQVQKGNVCLQVLQHQKRHASTYP